VTSERGSAEDCEEKSIADHGPEKPVLHQVGIILQPDVDRGEQNVEIAQAVIQAGGDGIQQK
jgi:hypothetical protein